MFGDLIVTIILGLFYSFFCVVLFDETTTSRVVASIGFIGFVLVLCGKPMFAIAFGAGTLLHRLIV